MLLFALLHSIAHAQQLPITIYSSKEGNSPLGNASIFQDKRGWIWFINGYEVVRYDGQRFKSYPPTQGTNIDYVFGLMEVNDETWVLGEPNTMKISGDSISLLNYIDPELSFQFCLQHRNKIFLLEQLGIYEYGEKSIKKISSRISNKFGTHAGLIPYADSLLLSYEHTGRLVLFNLNNGLSTTIDMQISDMQMDAKGNVFMLLNGNSFHRLNNIIHKGAGFDVITTPLYVSQEKNTKFTRFKIDQTGNFWAIEPLKRLTRITPDLKVNSFTESQGLPGLVFHDLLVDRENNIWIGYTGGACKISNVLWERLTKSEGLLLNQITFLVKDGENVFLGSEDGIQVYRNAAVETLMESGNLFNCYSLVCQDNQIWFNRGSELYTAMLHKTKPEIINVKKIANFPKGIRAPDMKLDRNGNLFIGTQVGLYAWYQNRLIKISTDSSHIRKIVIDKRNHLWAGKFIGALDHYAINYNNDDLNVSWIETISGTKNMLPLEKVRALEEDEDGNIFIGTRYNGLYHVKVKDGKATTIKQFDSKDGLDSKNIWGISRGNGGKIWISTSKGLNSIRSTASGWEVLDEGRNREIFGTSGVLFDQVRQRVWVVNHPGVVYFNSESKIPSYPFDVHLAVKPAGSSHFQDVQTEKEFPYDENDFSFELSANSYQNEKSIQYVYRLIKNGNEEWSQPSGNAALNFVSLNPGKYELRVKAVNANNQWSSNEAAYSFTILRPFWQQAWFIIIVILFVALGLYLLYRYRIRRVKEMFEMRQVIASDLHDEIGSSLTSIHILSKMSQLNVPNDQEKAQSLLERVIDQSSQIQQNMSDIVWAIRPDNDKMENMVMRMREHLNHSLEPKNIAIDFAAEEKLMGESLPMEQRRDFLLIFKEAVNNIAKYSQCKTTHIKLDRIDGNVRMLIEDDGVGFDINPQRSSSGIVNMQRRAALMKGSFRIDSAIGKGTRIEVMVPIT